MNGRVLGRLLIANPPLQTAEALADALQVSRGAISTTVRHLVDRGLVERLSLPGQRPDYYQVKPGAWSTVLQGSVALSTQLRLIADRGLALMHDQPAESRLRLEEMRSVYAFFEERFPELITEWEAYWQDARKTRE